MSFDKHKLHQDKIDRFLQNDSAKIEKELLRNIKLYRFYGDLFDLFLPRQLSSIKNMMTGPEDPDQLKDH